MAAIPATALPTRPLTWAVTEVSPCPPPRRIVRRWIVDPASGRLTAGWEADDEAEKPILHLWLARG